MKKAALLVLCVLMVSGQALFAGGSSEGAKSAADGEYRIGVCLRITGELGYKLRLTVEKAFGDINAAGGINGRKVKLFIYDEASSPATATDAMNRLIYDDKVLLIIGPTVSSVAKGTIGLADKGKTVLITPQSSNSQLTKQGSEWFFRMAVADVYYAHALADYLAGDLGKKRFAVVFETEALGVGQSQDFINRLKAKWGIEPVLVEKFSLGDIDFKSQMLKVKDVNPEVLVMAGHEVEMARAITQAYDIGLSKDILKAGFSSMSSKEYATTAGAAAAGSIFMSTFSANNPDPRVQAFVKEYGQALQVPPDHNYAQAYDTVNIIVNALKGANLKNTSESLAEDRVKLRDAIAAIKNYNGITGMCTFGPSATPEDRDGMKQPSVWRLNADGTFELLKASGK